MSNQVVYLEPDMVPRHLRGSYTGKKFKAQICETVTIPGQAGVWDHGTRETFQVIRIADGAAIEPVNHDAAPWDKRPDVPVTLEPGICVVRHSMFCGKDMGLTFYMHARDAVPMLPKQNEELRADSRRVLECISTYKSSYRTDEYRRMGLSELDVGKAKIELIAYGLIDSRGAITTKGRNALNRV